MCSVEDSQTGSLCVIKLKLISPCLSSSLLKVQGEVCTTILDVLFGGRLALVN